MSNTEKIDMLVEGGKAVAGPAIGQKLGPLKINIAEVLKKINEKTKDFKGMKVPVKLTIDKDTKEFEIEVGLPPVSELIKAELKLEKGSGIPDKYKTGNISIEHVIKIANMKKSSMFTDNLKSAVKAVIGSCNSLGVLIESKTAPEIIKDVDSGKYDKEINELKSQPSEEKLNQLHEDLIKSQEIGKKFVEQMEAEKAAKLAKASGAIPAVPGAAPGAAAPVAPVEEKKEEPKETKKPKKPGMKPTKKK